ncbi:hypothetical protein OG394_31585 [Kribbella sp. NBC_01245]|uniref:hypothetical protein n=1 Tax=Kribbella sp. NBC_01245 TaxID=2903578 RepID=UPI002E2CF8FD|nr:hypothetical protein [Kribbella sp. NBC_01245]
MRRTDKVAAVIGVTISVLVSIGLWLGFRGGDALEAEGANSLSMFGVETGDDVYFPVKTVQNNSRQIITLLAVVPESPSPGLEFVDAKVYDFHSATRTSKGKFARDWDPRPHLVGEVSGRQLVPEQALSDQILIHLRVTSDQRPLTVAAVKVTYRQYGRVHTQTLNTDVELH